MYIVLYEVRMSLIFREKRALVTVVRKPKHMRRREDGVCRMITFQQAAWRSGDVLS